MPSIVKKNTMTNIERKLTNSTVIDESAFKAKKIKKKGSQFMSMQSQEEKRVDVSFLRKEIIG